MGQPKNSPPGMLRASGVDLHRPPRDREPDVGPVADDPHLVGRVEQRGVALNRGAPRPSPGGRRCRGSRRTPPARGPPPVPAPASGTGSRPTGVVAPRPVPARRGSGLDRRRALGRDVDASRVFSGASTAISASSSPGRGRRSAPARRGSRAAQCGASRGVDKPAAQGDAQRAGRRRARRWRITSSSSGRAGVAPRRGPASRAAPSGRCRRAASRSVRFADRPRVHGSDPGARAWLARGPLLGGPSRRSSGLPLRPSV